MKLTPLLEGSAQLLTLEWTYPFDSYIIIIVKDAVVLVWVKTGSH